MPATADHAATLARLKTELALNRDFAGDYEAAFLSMAWTWQRLEAMGRHFFAGFGITDVQFNVLMILSDYYGTSFRQHELADILVVNRASIGGVLERMEKRGWVARVTDPDDRRAVRVKLTNAGLAKLQDVRGPYYLQLATLFETSDPTALRQQIAWFDQLRARLASLAPTEGA